MKSTWNQMSNHIISDQRGQPPDPRQAIRRAHQQPRAGVTDATRGSYQQPRTGMIHATRGKTISRRTFNICTYNPRTINDLKNHSLDTMLHELNNIKLDIVGFSKKKLKKARLKSTKQSAANCSVLAAMRLHDQTALAFL